MNAAALAGRVVGITADRRGREQASLFERRGAEVVHGPTMRTVDLSRDRRLRAVTEELVRRPPDVLVASTGTGMRWWLDAAASWGLDGSVCRALAGSRIVARGAKAASAVLARGLEVWWRAPGETMDEVVEHLRTAAPAGARIAVQLFDPEDSRSTDALRDTAADVVEVPVYRWAMPADPGPARRLVEAAADGRLDAVTFTSQPAVRHLFAIAEDLGRGEDLRLALNGPVLPACIGPVCAEAARAQGVARPCWPHPPRLAAMVRQVADALGPSGPPGT